MSADAPFLAAIAAAPLDALPKLVYADWLDDRGDPRGRLVRLSHELRFLLPTAPEFWAKHAEREVLAAGCDPDWLRVVGTGNDCTPVFAHGWPDDIAGRWRTVRAAAERLLGKTLGDIGGHADRLRGIERELEFTLPESVREWVAFVLDAADPADMADAFLNGFNSAAEWSADRGLFFLGGGGRYERLGIPNDRMGDADPPVFEYEADDGDGWELDEDAESYAAVSEFALFRLLDECHGTGGRVRTWLPATADLRQKLDETFPPAIKFHNADVWERPGVVVEIYTPPGADQEQVTVSVQEGVPAADVPAFLFDFTTRRREVSGLFIPELFREPRDARAGRRPPMRSFADPSEEAYQRGWEFCDGIRGRVKSDTEAVRWFRMAADLGHAEAATQLAYMTTRGEGVAKDVAEAVRLYRLGAERGSAGACCSLGAYYRDGTGVPQDHTAAADWFRRSAAGGDSDAMCDLGNLYWNGRGVNRDDAEAVRWYRQAIDQNANRAAMSNLGNAYRLGRGVEQCFATAFDWYRRAADRNDASGANSLGWCYDQGVGVPQDRVEAFKWYRRAADLGLALGHYNVGCSLRDGEGTAADVDAAVGFFRTAAELGYAYAKYEMGRIHRDGRGLPQDHAEAVHWFTLAADGGHAKATNDLGTLFERGHGVAHDHPEAVRLYRRAADLGSVVAHYNIGRMLEHGLGVARDAAEALACYRKAAELGDEKSKAKVAELTPPAE